MPVFLAFRVAARNPASRRAAGVQAETRPIEGVGAGAPGGCCQSVASQCAEGSVLSSRRVCGSMNLPRLPWQLSGNFGCP
jgi:hypothetical protein